MTSCLSQCKNKTRIKFDKFVKMIFYSKACFVKDNIAKLFVSGNEAINKDESSLYSFHCMCFPFINSHQSPLRHYLNDTTRFDVSIEGPSFARNVKSHGIV
jgi:hypothetical protein